MRAKQIGLTTEDLDNLTYGLVTDMLIESGNDDYNYPTIATQEDIDNF